MSQTPEPPKPGDRVLLSSLHSGDAILHDGMKGVVSIRGDDHTSVRYEGGGIGLYAWAKTDPVVEYLGKGRLTFNIDEAVRRRKQLMRDRRQKGT